MLKYKQFSLKKFVFSCKKDLARATLLLDPAQKPRGKKFFKCNETYLKKYRFDIQGSHLVFFTLKVMLLEVAYIMVKMNILALLPLKW